MLGARMEKKKITTIMIIWKQIAKYFRKLNFVQTIPFLYEKILIQLSKLFIRLVDKVPISISDCEL